MLCRKFELIPIKIGLFTNFKSCSKSCFTLYRVVEDVHINGIPIVPYIPYVPLYIYLYPYIYSTIYVYIYTHTVLVQYVHC